MKGWLAGIAVAAGVFIVACGGGAQAPAAAPAPPQAQPPAAPAPAAPAAEPQVPAPAPATAPVTAPPQRSPAVTAAEKPKYGGTVRWAIVGDPRGGFDPHIPGGRPESRRAFGLTYEHLAANLTPPDNPCGFQLVPVLAQSWRFLDPTTLEITLRKGVKFANKPPVNGREMQAADVVFSYQRMFKRGELKTVGDAIASIEATGPSTVRIKTKEPRPILPDELFTFQGAVIMASEAAGPGDNYGTLPTAIGTGAFVLEEYTSGVRITAARNPQYWVPGKPYVDRVELPFVRDVGTRVAAFEVGKLDFLEELSPGLKDRLSKRRPEIPLLPCEDPYIGLVLNQKHPPLNDVRVRRAFSLALDREGIIKGIYRGEGVLLGSTSATLEGALSPKEMPPEVRKWLAHNSQEARRLLAEAGYPNGLSVQIFFGSHLKDPTTAVIEALPAMFRSAGITATLKPVPQGEYAVRVTKWDFGSVGVLTGGLIGTPPIELNLYERAHSASSPDGNRNAINDPDVDRLLDQMVQTVDRQRRLELARQVQLILVDKAYMIGMPAWFSYNAALPRLRGLEANPNRSHHRYWTSNLLQSWWVAE